MDNFVFSIVMAVYNVEDYLKEAIDSVINQSLSFKKNVQLILVDDGSTDSSKEIALDYESKYPNNIMVLSKENGGPGSARNLGLEYVKGRFINFLDADDKLSKNTLKNVYNFFLKYENEVDVVAIPIEFLELRDKFDFYENFKETQVIDLSNDFNYIQNSISSTFIKKEALTNFKFNEELVYSEDVLLINQILLEKYKIGFVKESIYYYRRRRKKTAILNIYRFDERFFTERLNLFFKELINYSLNKKGSVQGSVPKFIQYVLAYNMQFILSTNIENIIQNQDLDEFWDCLWDVLKYFDSNLVFNHEFIIDNVRTFFVSLLNKNVEIVKKENDVLLMSNDYVLSHLSESQITIDIVEIRDGFFNISGYLRSNLSPDKISIIAIKEKINSTNSSEGKNCEVFKTKYFNYEARKPTYYLSYPWRYYHSFDLSIPIDDENFRVSFKVIYNDEDNEIPIKSSPIIFRNYAPLSYKSHYLVKDSKLVVFRNQFFYLMPYSLNKRLRYEFRGLLKILQDRDKFFILGLLFRIGYLILYPFLINKEIWIFMDRKDRADDNAEHLFKYAVNQKDDIKKYFAVQKNSPDFNRLKKLYGSKLVAFGSIKHRFLYLFTDKLVSSQATGYYLNPFTYKNPRLYAGLFTNRLYFLQHGIIQQDLSSWMTKFNKNVSLILTSSELETESLYAEGYNYDKSIIKTFGLPRYDNLNNQNLKKQIVIMPTWRADIKNEYNLLHSEYFKRFNNLINNKKLINHAKEKGYSIIFKPHPNLYEYIHLFDTNDYVEVDYIKKYQDIFNESALMITDFSTVAFDFSYLKKPVIYYQYANEHRFDLDSGYFKYDSMGFGEVIVEEDDLIDKIIEYIDNNCKMEDKYKKRVDKFFKYNDRNNCKRSYDWIKKH